MIKHLYIHVPFCKTICSYCDFCHVTYNEDLVNKWLSRFKEEIKECGNEQYETIYIGGGTPTSLSDDNLEELLKLVRPHANNIQEYTIEINPDTLSSSKADILVKYGINRASIGLQSSSNEILKLLNRNHTFQDVKRCVELLRQKGISNISLDIMYSLPNQTMDDLKNTINDVLGLNVPHLSLYSLTIEENTIFGKKGYKSLDEDMEADMYEYNVNTLTDNGYIQYEVANFSKPGYESKHNLGYWHYEDFRGLSCGSSSKIGNLRYDKVRSINKYLNSKDIIETEYPLEKEDMMFENIMMSLRLKEGLDIEEFNRKYNTNLTEIYKKGINNPNIEIYDNHLICTNREILNSVLVDFME